MALETYATYSRAIEATYKRLSSWNHRCSVSFFQAVAEYEEISSPSSLPGMVQVDQSEGE